MNSTKSFKALRETEIYKIKFKGKVYYWIMQVDYHKDNVTKFKLYDSKTNEITNEKIIKAIAEKWNDENY